MLRMEGNCLPEARHQALPPSVENIGWNRDLPRANSDASYLTAENCGDSFCCLEALKRDDLTAWTDDKHKLYLHHLEVSFVKQLHQSKHLLAQCKEQNQRVTNISQKQLIDVNNDSKQFNVSQNVCWQKINCGKDDLPSRCNPADSHTPFRGKWMHNLKHKYVHCPPPSAAMPEFLKLCSKVRHGKLIRPHELATGSQEFSTNNPHHGDLYALTREGMGQNFSDEDHQSTSNYESRAKRSKTALADSSSQDQIVRSWKCPTSDFSH